MVCKAEPDGAPRAHGARQLASLRRFAWFHQLMSSPAPARSARHSLASPLWVLAFLVSVMLPLASLGVAVAAVLTTYKGSAAWKRASVVAVGLVVVVFQLSIFLPGTTTFHEGPERVVHTG